MNLAPTQTDETSLTAFGQEASALLMRQDYAELANRFGYARAYGREPATAIEADFLGVSALPGAVVRETSVKVRYFAANNMGLFAMVECIVPAAKGAAVLLELTISGKGEEMQITVDDISRVAA